MAPKRDRTWLYAVVGVLLAIGGAGAWMLTRQQEINSLIGRPAATPAAAAVVPSIDKLATPAEAAKPEPPAVAPAVAPAPQAAAEAPPAATAAGHRNERQQTDTGGRIHVPEGAVSRGAKSKPQSAHRRRPAAESAGDEDEKPATPAVEPKNADPFAEIAAERKKKQGRSAATVVLALVRRP